MTSEILLRRIRQKAFDYPEHRDNQLSKVLDYLKRRIARNKPKESTGLYSGLTKRELRRTGMCETDFY